MGTPIKLSQNQGLVLQDERVCNENLHGKTDAINPSVYSQESPRPGTPTPSQHTDLTLEASHKQSEDGHLQIMTQRAGHPVPEEAGYVWKNVAGGDGEQWNGWDTYAAATGWESIFCSDVGGLNPDMNIIRLQSGNMLLTGGRDAVPGPVQGVFMYDVETATFARRSGVFIADESSGFGLVQLPTGRILALFPYGDQLNVYYSDDDGKYWYKYSFSALKTPLTDHYGAKVNSIRRVRAAYSAGEVCLLIWWEDSQDTEWGDPPVTERLWDVTQYASDDLGQNFTRVGNVIAELAGDITDLTVYDLGQIVRYPKILPQHGGGFWMGAYRKHGIPADTKSYYFTRTIASAFLPLLDVDDLVVYRLDQLITDLGVNNDYGCAWWVDEDNTYYVLVEDTLDTATVADADPGTTHLILRSLDSGATWGAWKSYTLQTDDVPYRLTGFDIDCTGGKALMPTRWTEGEGANDYAGNSLNVLYLGGFSTHTLPNGLVYRGGDFNDPDHIGWGDVNVNDYTSSTLADGRLYLPIGFPSQMGWTQNGIGAGQSLNCHLRVVTGAAEDLWYSEDPVQQGNQNVIVEGSVFLSTAGSIISDEVVLGASLCDGATYRFEVQVRFSNTGFVVYDVVNAVVKATVVVTPTSRIHVRLLLGGPNSSMDGSVAVWYSVDDDIEGHVRTWSGSGTSYVLTNAVAFVGTDQVYWGHHTAAINISDWWMVGHNFFPSRWAPKSLYLTGWFNPAALHPRSYPSLPSLVYDGVKLRAQSGPTRLDEEFTIKAEYDYPISNLDPRISPSPNQTWREDTTATTTLYWDMGASPLSKSLMDNIPIAIFALNANLKEMSISYWDGGAHVPVAQVDSFDGWDKLPFLRVGQYLVPDPAGAVAAAGYPRNYLYYNAHVGDTIYFTATGQTATVVSNTEGAWYTDGTGVPKVKFPRIKIDDYSAGLGLPASGEMAIFRKNFGVVIPNLTTTDLQTLRIQFLNQPASIGGKEVGLLYVGPLVAFGQQYDRGWSIQDTYNNDLIARQDRQTRSRIKGLPRKVVGFSWAEGVINLTQTQGENPNPDFTYGQTPLAAGDEYKSAFANRNDPTRTVAGFINRIGQSDLPILLLRNIPITVEVEQEETTNIPLTGTLDHIYGRIVNDPQIDNVMGTEMCCELERLNIVTIEEEV